MQTQPIKLNPDDELARRLNQKDATPVFVEANGVRFRVIRDTPEINLTNDPFADYDPSEGIALWSLWEMPSTIVGSVVRRGRPPGEPTAVRSVRLPVALWNRLEKEAAASKTTMNGLIRRRVS